MRGDMKDGAGLGGGFYETQNSVRYGKEMLPNCILCE